MPLFYFDIYNDGELARDEFGIDLEDLGEARDQAIALLPDLARDEGVEGDRHDFTAVVMRQDRRVCYRATLSLRGEWVEPPEDHRAAAASSHGSAPSAAGSGADLRLTPPHHRPSRGGTGCHRLRSEAGAPQVSCDRVGPTVGLHNPVISHVDCRHTAPEGLGREGFPRKITAVGT